METTRRDEAQRVLMTPLRPVKVVHCKPASVVGVGSTVLVEMTAPLVLTTRTSVKTTVLVRVAGAALAAMARAAVMRIDFMLVEASEIPDLQDGL